MRALTEKQQRFVLAMFSRPTGTATGWVKAAGYSNSEGGFRVTAHRLMHDPKVSAAVQEFASQHLSVVGPALSLGVLMKIARTKDHKDQFKAAAALANRSGFHETTEHRVLVTRMDRTGEGALARIKAAAELLGVDPTTLLGENAPMKQIEGKVVDVTAT